jgi:hypothetical protein
MALPTAPTAVTPLATLPGAGAACMAAAWGPAVPGQWAWAALYQHAFLDAVDRARRENWWRRGLPGLN